jgi:hypothetical protein
MSASVRSGKSRRICASVMPEARQVKHVADSDELRMGLRPTHWDENRSGVLSFDGVAGRKPAKNEDARNRSLWRLNAVNSQVTRTMHRPVQPWNEAPSFLESCIFRLCQRWIFEFPRISHPSAVPVVNLRVAPNLRSSSGADDKSSGCPESCILWLCRR